jgi:nucleoside-diphosphate-sugar epimerase
MLVTGALGQIGSELVQALRLRHGVEQVLATDIRQPANVEGPFHLLDVTDRAALMALVREEGITQIYHLAAILSARGEQNPTEAWDINMGSLLNVLEVARQAPLDQVFWPSSIAVFGPSAPKDGTPQQTITDPSTVYGISKLAGERWCAYYHRRYGVDVRSIRYPGLIGYQGLPGGGTTDYAVEIFHAALRQGHYTSFLAADTALPMLFMPDAIRGTIELMEAPSHQIQVRDAYNLQGLTFTPAELTQAIAAHRPGFHCDYAPDFRQAIADSWPSRLIDEAARHDWGWQPHYDLAGMTEMMLTEVAARYASSEKAP